MMPTLPEHVAAMEAELWRVVVAAYQAGKAETEVENVALRAVVEAARDYRAYCRAREATWASWTQCEDAAHPGHTEDDCPAWGSVASDTMSDGDPEPIFAALAALDTPTTTSERLAPCAECGPDSNCGKVPQL